MERLTYTDKDGGVCCPWERNSVNGSYDIWDEEGLIKQLNRLAAYEDTGLEPEDVRRLQQDWTSLIMTLDEMGGMPHLHELVQAEQGGRLVVLPCKVGDHVWVNGREAIVVWFFGYKTERYLHTQFLDNAQYIDIPFSEIGKTVFLTREEEEAELAGEGISE